jgi:hypothetical protein
MKLEVVVIPISDVDRARATQAGAALVRGVGLGLAVTPLTAAVLAAVGDADRGEASAINDAGSRHPTAAVPCPCST